MAVEYPGIFRGSRYDRSLTGDDAWHPTHAVSLHPPSASAATLTGVMLRAHEADLRETVAPLRALARRGGHVVGAPDDYPEIGRRMWRLVPREYVARPYDAPCQLLLCAFVPTDDGTVGADVCRVVETGRMVPERTIVCPDAT